MQLNKRMKDLTGEKKGRLTAVSPSHKNNNNSLLWNFDCDCGNKHVARGADFSIGKQLSCGCYQKEVRFSHNMSNTREYGVWRGMKSRCHESTREHEVSAYQDRGITVCEEWLNSFETFYEDMGGIPKGFDIDRIDNNKGYSKDNCRLVSRKINLQNKRDSYIWSYGGNDYGSAQDLADALGVSCNTIFNRTLGYKHNRNGKSHPPAEGYSRRLKYEDTE